MNKNILLLAAAGIGLYFFMNKNRSGIDTTGYDPALVAAWIAKMKATPEWYAAEIEKATAKGISIDDQLLIDAKWVIDQGWVL